MNEIWFVFNIFNCKFNIPHVFQFVWQDVEVQREKTIESLSVRSVVRLSDCWYKQGESCKKLYTVFVTLYLRTHGAVVCHVMYHVMLPHTVPETPIAKIIVEEFLVFVAGIPNWVDIFCVLQG